MYVSPVISLPDCFSKFIKQESVFVYHRGNMSASSVMSLQKCGCEHTFLVHFLTYFNTQMYTGVYVVQKYK